ncbi:hypothetical protein [Dictyobacter arantiisoli]|uniref:Uncharacterized protein n=1 Tax=Dictyobacter arantiisoli TaxID=2014874 RepID=A0A5A5T712_9CHLR|nr:hypothetical protein [Dictyobacter arantiisoli]GCF07192.1 hypothetical protein KDI_07560 [Dictyobacter arantiisoli]
MQERTISNRISYVAFACAILLTLVLEGTYAQKAAAQTLSHVNPHSVTIHPHHIFAGTITDTGTFSCQSNTAAIRCYGPQQIRQAYSIQPLLNRGVTGKNQTIVILDAYSAPSIASDLHAFDKRFGLNDPKLNIIAGEGSLTPWDPTDPLQTNWAGEIALDVEWSHVVAPDATTGWGSPIVSKFVPLLVAFTGGPHLHDYDRQVASIH